MTGATRCRLIAAAVLVIGSTISPVAAQKAPGVGKKTPAQSTAAVLRLRDATQQAWERRRTQLPPQEVKAIETLGRTIRSNPGQLFATWLSFGTIHQLWSPFVDIPVDKANSQLPADIARAFLNEQRDLFGASTAGLVLATSPSKSRSVRFVQRAREGRPVFAAEAYVNVGLQNGIHLVTANLLPDDALPPPSPPKLTSDEARARVGGTTRDAILGYYSAAFFGRPWSTEVFLAWRVHVLDQQERFVYIDDRSGNMLSESLLSAAEIDRQVFYCEDCTELDLPGTLEFADICNPPPFGPPDPAACLSPRLVCTDPGIMRSCVKTGDAGMSGSSRAIMDVLGDIETFFSSVLFRARWATAGVSSHGIRASSDANNLTSGTLMGSGPRFDDCHAEWRFVSAAIAPAQIAAGSRRFCRDAIAHEYLHAIFDARDGLSASGCTQSKSIEEGYGDVFAELIEAHYVGSADWRKGTGCSDCGIPGRASLASPPPAPCVPGTFSVCGTLMLDRSPISSPETWSFFRERCSGDFNSSVVGKLGHLMGRNPAEGAAPHGGLNVAGIGPRAAEVWYNAEELLLSSTSTFTDLRVALLDACAARAPAAAVDCASAAEAVGIWSPDLIETIALDPRPVPGSDVARGAALGDRPGESFAFYYQPSGVPARSGELMAQHRPCTLLESCAWEPPLIWRRAIVGPDRILPQTPVVVRRPIPTGGDQLWVCYRDAGGISCDFIDDGGRHTGPILSGHDVAGDISAAILNGTLHVAFTNSDGHLMLTSHVIGVDTGFRTPRAIIDRGAPVDLSALPVPPAPVLAAGVIDDAGTRALLVSFIAHDTDMVVVERINPDTARLDGGWAPMDDGREVYTPRRPAMALFHERVHVALTDVRDVLVRGSRRADNALWIASNIAPPSVRPQPSPLVTQPGFFRPAFTFYEGVGGALHLIHATPDGTRVVRRFKMSR